MDKKRERESDEENEEKGKEGNRGKEREGLAEWLSCNTLEEQ